MRYFILNKVEYEEHNELPEVLRVPERVFKLMGECIKHVRKSRNLERELLDVLAKSNNLSVREIDDLIATNDWGVDQISYGIYAHLEGEISEKEYKKFKKELEQCNKNY